MTELGDKLRALRQQAIDSGEMVPGEMCMTNDLDIRCVLAIMAERFTSANSVPVERAMIKRDEWDMVMARLSLLECRVAALAALHYGAPDALPQQEYCTKLSNGTAQGNKP